EVGVGFLQEQRFEEVLLVDTAGAGSRRIGFDGEPCRLGKGHSGKARLVLLVVERIALQNAVQLAGQSCRTTALGSGARRAKDSLPLGGEPLPEELRYRARGRIRVVL